MAATASACVIGLITMSSLLNWLTVSVRCS